MNLQSKFGNGITTKTLNVELYIRSGTERQMDAQTIGLLMLLDAPWWNFQAGAIKTVNYKLYEISQNYSQNLLK